jgi:hypothetical protein
MPAGAGMPEFWAILKKVELSGKRDGSVREENSPDETPGR